MVLGVTLVGCCTIVLQPQACVGRFPKLKLQCSGLLAVLALSDSFVGRGLQFGPSSLKALPSCSRVLLLCIMPSLRHRLNRILTGKQMKDGLNLGRERSGSFRITAGSTGAS